MKEFFRNGGIGEVLKIALPLVVATSCHAVNNLVDRIMLSHYSQDAMAAAMPAHLIILARWEESSPIKAVISPFAFFISACRVGVRSLPICLAATIAWFFRLAS